MKVKLSGSISICGNNFDLVNGLTWGLENKPKNLTLWCSDTIRGSGRNLRPEGISPIYERTITIPRVT